MVQGETSMKKTVFFALLISALAAALLGCSLAAPEDTVDPEYLFATVIEAGTSPLVEPTEGSTELASADRIYISTSAMTDEQSVLTLRALREGDTVRIAYDGLIAETYPAQINGGTEIRFVDKNDHDVVIGWQRATVIKSEYSKPGRPAVSLYVERIKMLAGESADVYLLQPDYSNDPEVEERLAGLEPGDDVAVCTCLIFESQPSVIDVFRILRVQAVFGEEA